MTRLSRSLLPAAAIVAGGVLALTPGARAEGDLERFALAPDSVFEAHTTSGGLLGGLGHPHRIRATRVSGMVELDRAQPARSSVEVVVSAPDLEVATSGADEKDRAKIEKGMHEDVLRSASHPRIVFRSTAVSPTADGIRVTGELELVGVAAPATVDLATTWEEPGALRVTGAFTLRMTDFEIDPPTALLGSIVVGDEVRIEIDALATAQETRQNDGPQGSAAPEAG